MSELPFTGQSDVIEKLLQPLLGYVERNTTPAWLALNSPAGDSGNRAALLRPFYVWG